jgi:hypothetical protein
VLEHIGYLRFETTEPPHPYYLCGHKGGCNTVAGFYRNIAAGGEGYPPSDMVWQTFNTNFLEKDDEDQTKSENCDAVKGPLAELEVAASELVCDLIKSTLHLPTKDELDYLTCVMVGPEDVPWDVSGNDGDGEDSDGD